ncbi:sensor histidine kinase [Streptomyces sp. 8N616]|uniref:sensor histidine kinase n=1 Tax=Streptomyces sp. 8N616 TaxID=3457414 RepID=UPI003FCEED48
MNPPWIELAFDRRFAVIRAWAVSAILVGDLLLVQHPSGPKDWALALAGFVLCLAVSRWTFTAALALAGLLVVAHWLRSDVVLALKVLASVSVFELAVQRSGRRLAVGSAAVAIAVAVNRLGDLPGEFLSVLYKMGIVAGLPLLMGAYVREIREAARQAREHAAQEARRAEQKLAAARATERTAIARELHDLVAHHVSSMVLRVGVARHVLRATDPRVSEIFDDLHASGSAALTDLRRLVAVLRDPDNDDPGTSLVDPATLPTALRAVVERSQDAGLVVEASVDPGVSRLDAVRGLAVLRLAQEGLANAAKHAGAGAQVRMTVQLADDAVRLSIRDDGGTHHNSAAARSTAGQPPAGHGLIGMHERVELLGGRLDVGPDGHGWQLSAELPAAAQRLELQP